MTISKQSHGCENRKRCHVKCWSQSYRSSIGTGLDRQGRMERHGWKNHHHVLDVVDDDIIKELSCHHFSLLLTFSKLTHGTIIHYKISCLGLINVTVVLLQRNHFLNEKKWKVKVLVCNWTSENEMLVGWCFIYLHREPAFLITFRHRMDTWGENSCWWQRITRIILQ